MTKETAYSRRQMLRIGALSMGVLLAGCGPGALTPNPAPAPASGSSSLISDYIKGIASGILGAATSLGVSQSTLVTIADKANSLEAIANKISGALASGGAIASYAQAALPLIETIVSFIPGGSAATGILTAVQTLLPVIAAAAGRQLAIRPTGIEPAAALATLQLAANGRL